ASTARPRVSTVPSSWAGTPTHSPRLRGERPWESLRPTVWPSPSVASIVPHRRRAPHSRSWSTTAREPTASRTAWACRGAGTPPHGGPADADITTKIQSRANELIRSKLAGVRRISLAKALAADTTRTYDFVTPYVEALSCVVNMEAIASAKLRLGVDPLGGSG